MEHQNNFSTSEAAGFAAFCANYPERNPRPAKPTVRGLWSWEHWRFWFLLVPAVAGVLLTSLRTYPRFYEAATGDFLGLGLGGPWAHFEAILAVFAIDFLLPVLAAVRAYSKLKKDGKESNDSAKIWIAIWITLALVIVAGLSQSLHVSTDLMQLWGGALDIFLVLAMGLGVAFDIYVVGDLLGSQFAGVVIENENASKAYGDLYAEWVAQRLSDWQASPHYKSLLSNFRKVDIYTRKNILDNITTGSNGHFGSPSASPIPKDNPKRTMLIKWMNAYFDQHGTAPEFAEVWAAFEGHVARSYVSTTRTNWLGSLQTQEK